MRAGDPGDFLVAAQQCLAVTEVVADAATVCSTDASGGEWCLSMGDPGILEAHPVVAASAWAVTHDAGDTYAGLPSYALVSGLCASWSAETGTSGPLPHTRYMLIEAQQRLNGGGCANGGFTLPDSVFASDDVNSGSGRGRGGGDDRGGGDRGGGGGPIRPATSDPLPSDDHVGGVVPRPASDWCLDVTRGGNIETWTSKLSGGRQAVALLNRSPSAERVGLSLADDLALPIGTRWTAHDAWTDSSVPLSASGESVRGLVNVERVVEAHGVEVMVLSPLR